MTKPKYTVEINRSSNEYGKWSFSFDKWFGNYSSYGGPSRSLKSLKKSIKHICKSWFELFDGTLGRELKKSEFPNRNNLQFKSECPGISKELFFKEITLLWWC